MTPLVSVITPTIPERAPLLAECVRSVESQTFRNFEHIIWEDVDREGCAVTVNRLAERAQGEWLFLIADDDLMLPGCLATHVAASEQADVVYAPPLVTGNEDRWWFFQTPPAIPSTALIRASLWRELGGYDNTLRREEDRDLWVKAVKANARFVRTDASPSWVYRLHGQNKSFQQSSL